MKDEIIYCPHFHQKCECRKPKPGMILTLAEKYDIDLESSWMVGDRDTDILAGNGAGCRTIKLGKVYDNADYSCEHLGGAVEYILQ